MTFRLWRCFLTYFHLKINYCLKRNQILADDDDDDTDNDDDDDTDNDDADDL